jgi:hypothetical protein
MRARTAEMTGRHDAAGLTAESWRVSKDGSA